jgi:tRNA pseudouridine38-40 synthase
VRTIKKAQWFQPNPNLLIFEVQGDGFLRQMIRNIVATQLALFRSNQDETELKRILSAKNRALIGKPAPPQGLFLHRVHYPKRLRERSLQID